MALASTVGIDPLARVIESRQGQVTFRLGLAVVIAAIFHVLTGWAVSAIWMAAYAIHQTVEHAYFRDVSAGQILSPRRCHAALASIFASNVIFGLIGLLGALRGGPWGMVCACLLWSGAIVNATVGTVGSRSAFVAWTCMPAAYFVSAPFLAVHYGAKFEYGLVILLAGVMNTVAMMQMWSSSQKRIDAEEQARRVSHLALHDPETGLPNRHAFEHEIAERIDRERDLVVAVLGIDRFADLRGAIGYALAARLIQQVAERLRDVHDGTIAQLSTSRLGVLLRAEDMAEARFYAARLQSVMASPLRMDDTEVDVSLTIGLAGELDEAGPLLERASIALDQSSKAGGSIAVFDEAKYKNPIANLSLMSEMLRSIERGDITNFYQPKYDLRSGRLIGVEALVRWRHPERGMIPPDMFISMAEDTGRIRELTIDVLSRAIRDQARLAERGHLLSFAVNLSGRLLHDDEITETILDIVSPAVGKVVLEVTETSMMENPKTALGILHQFRGAGLELSIDDYGSGLSSLAYLKNIPAHELKIDKAFVIHMDESRQDALLVRSTVALAHSLGLRVTAEGVESAATLALLRSMNCDCAQGYHMSRPIPFDDLAALLDKGADIAIVDFRQHTGATGDDLGGANPTGKLPTPLPWAS